jgi:GNAT superfamily N-acetyltransferase
MEAPVQVTQPVSPEDFERYFALRWEVLRMPWRQPRGSERDPLDDTSVHGMIRDAGGEILAVGRVHMTGPEEAQVRYMGVRADRQGRGLGSRMLRFLEDEARARGAKRVILQAREPAVPFYRRQGYDIVEKTYLLFGEIQHYLMQKESARS